MTQRTALCGTTAILIALAGAAQADVTAADVWQNWKAAAESMGQVLTPGSISDGGGTLTISDLQIAMEIPEVNVSGAIEMIEFAENGDGTVSITMSPRYTMSIDANPEQGEDVQADLAITQAGLDMVASGDPEAITYDMSAEKVDVAVESLVVDEEAVELTAVASASGITAKYEVAQGDMTEVATELAAGNMSVTLDMKEPGGGDGFFTINMDMADLAADSVGNLVMLADPTVLSQALQDGMATSTSMTHGAATYDVVFQDGRDAFAMQGSAATGAFDVVLNADALGYTVSNTGLDITMSGSEIPLPEIALQAGEIGFSFLMPASPSEEAKDVGFGLRLVDLSVSDMIWSMIDAGGQLPRDPATLIVDVTGKANLLVDIFNPEAMMAAESDMPGGVEALDLNELQLSIAGAELTGSGGFTFDMDDMTTFGGVPAPTGAIDLTLSGSNALMDKLVAMGLLPEEQAMGAKMMMGMFAKPAGEDVLTSTIEVDGATGAISANGQRLQ